MGKFFPLPILVLSIFMSGCAQNITVDLSSHLAPSDDGKLTAVPSKEIRLDKIQDARKPGVSEGTREAAFGVPMGNITFSPTPEIIINDIISSEIKKAGHKLISEKSTYEISGNIVRFDVGTNTTPLYWDINGYLFV